MSERYVRRCVAVEVGVGMHAVHAGSVLRQSGLDGSDGCVQVRLLLRRRQLGVDASLQRVVGISVPRELQRRDVFVGEEHDRERCVSAGPLLRVGQRVAVALSAGHELYVNGLVVVDVPTVHGRILLSERGYVAGGALVSCGLLLSSGHDRSSQRQLVGMSSGLVLSGGQQAAVVVSRGSVPRPGGSVIMHDVSGGIVLRGEHRASR